MPGGGAYGSRQARQSAENKHNVNNKRPTGDGSNNSKPSAQATLKVKTDGKTRVVTTIKPSRKAEEDLRVKLNAKRAATTAPKDQVANTAQTHLPRPNNIAADEPQNKQIANLMEIEPFSSPPSRRSLNAKHQLYTRWDGSQAMILSPTVTAPSSPEPNGPAPATISTSPPAAHLAALRQIFHLPQTTEEPETEDVPSSSVEEQFEALAEQSRSVAGYDATCTRSFARGTSISRAFYREWLLCTYTVPVASSFAFNVNASVAVPTSVPFKSTRNRQCGGKASLTDVDDDLDNIPLAERRRRKRRRTNEHTTSDDIDFCLAGSSVVDPLLHLEDLPPLPSSPTLATSEVASQAPSEPSSEEVTVEVLAEGYAPWASAMPHSPPSA